MLFGDLTGRQNQALIVVVLIFVSLGLVMVCGTPIKTKLKAMMDISFGCKLLYFD